MKTLPNTLLSLTALAALSAPGLASPLGGGPSDQTAQAGPWTDPDTWQSGVVPSLAAATQITVRHDVESAAAGQGGANMIVGAGATLTISAGDLTPQFLLLIGFQGDGTIDVTGGQLTSVLDATELGYVDGTGILQVRGGDVDLLGLRIGDTLDAGRLLMEGSTGSLEITNTLRVGEQGTFTVRPTADGASGLAPVICDRVNYRPGSVLELDTSLYTPEVGDSWEIAHYTTSVTNTPTTLTAPEGYTIVEEQSTPGVVRLTVTEVPSAFVDLGGGSPGAAGTPVLEGLGTLVAGTSVGIELSSAPASAPVLAWLALAPTSFAALGGTVHAFPYINQLFFTTGAAGELSLATTWPAGVPPGTELTIQFICQDLSVPDGLVLSNGIRGVAP